MSRRGPIDIAIVGMACRFPGAPDLFAYWENILKGVDATSDVPADRWDPAVFFDPDSTANDRVPCRRGGYLDSPIPFDPARTGSCPTRSTAASPSSSSSSTPPGPPWPTPGLAGGVADGGGSRWSSAGGTISTGAT